VNRRLEEMFGYQHGELPGARCRSSSRQPSAVSRRVADWSEKGRNRFPGPIALGRFGENRPLTCGDPPDGTETTQRETPAAIFDRDPAALAAQQRHLEEILNRITSSIIEVGVRAEHGADMSPGGLDKRIDEAVRLLDDIVRGSTMPRSVRPVPH